MTNNETSWGKVADWYDNLLETDADSYQRQVILPNLLRLVEPKAGQRILDLACGTGFFARELAKSGAEVVGVDISAELINLAKKQESQGISYFISPAHELSMLPSASVDAVTNILAIQNIAEVKQVFAEVKRVLKPGTKFIIVMNHPAFRLPKNSSWGWDEERQIQYRRLDRYMSEMKTGINMHPGKGEVAMTVSFHRPLQYYFKLLVNAGLTVTRLEEWSSHKTSERGPRQRAEDVARKEFPLFLCLEARLG